MKATRKLIINTVSVTILFFTLIVFSLYFFYTQDLKNREIDLIREVGKFLLSTVEERLTIVKDKGSEEIIRDTIAYAADYYDLGEHIHILVFHSDTGAIVYPFYSTARKVDTGILTNINQYIARGTFEGGLYLKEQLGYFFRYKNERLTFFIYTRTGELFKYRNQLIYLIAGLFVMCVLSLLIVENGMLRTFRHLIRELMRRFEGGPLRKQKVVEGVTDRYGPEVEGLLGGYNKLITNSASFLKRLEGKLKKCLKQRENLKKLIILYRKHIANKELLSLNESNVSNITSRRQDVASMSLELVGFLEPIGELYPQVITEELGYLHSFLKKESSSHGGMINFSNGYFFNLVYGVPSYDEMAFPSAINGSKAALDFIESRNSSGQNRSGIKWEMKIGLSYGPGVTGTVGDSYVVIGEVVDKSMKMLEHAKFYGVALATDSETEIKKYGKAKYRRLDLVSTGHDTLPEAYVYEIFLQDDNRTDNAIKLYSHGLEMFFEGKYDVALYDFKKVKKLLGEDNPSDIFLERCDRLIRGSS
ncbi:MAG: hypothetical protein JSV25_01120 [Spirochaetota bacterium]|nr:MAG: hypothetical protein JSV25_01120 [Spirochaetota bacterium]